MTIIKQQPYASILCASFLTLSFASPIAMASEKVIEKAIEQEIEIIKEDGDDANVTVSENGTTHTVSLSEAALKDKKALKRELASLPEETQKIVMDALSNVSMSKGDKGEMQVLQWKEKGGEEVEIISHGKTKAKGKVIVVETESDSDTDDHEVKIIKKIVHSSDDGEHPVFISANSEGGTAKAIVHLLERADLSKQEVAQIQQALDAKKR
ncbi:hypothetical protein FE810_06415 [Thalassotalea litorea]|uniref:Uncharacterized protein n=1 Tax=Thalassotalea litorea TaxID=2020715 RepID=A0A5R9IM22_9GAMM|nr:hypothetical protein [Thalassotalea litorea]TLU66322.1 hypothetical protein FE810_06415 [Thalassotalea litorea]